MEPATPFPHRENSCSETISTGVSSVLCKFSLAKPSAKLKQQGTPDTVT